MVGQVSLYDSTGRYCKVRVLELVIEIGCIFYICICVIFILTFLTSCYDPSTKQLESLTDLMNKADRKTCIYYTGNAGPYVTIRGITALGQVDFDTCLQNE
jgi:hypothetical protein